MVILGGRGTFGDAGREGYLVILEGREGYLVILGGRDT